MQGLETELDKHRKGVNMFQHAIEYNTQMTNILLKLSNLEIINKDITEDKNKFVQNMQGALEEQKLKAKLQVK
jgi:predicted nucleic acid-binding protein